MRFTLDDPAAFAWGGEPIVIDGRPVGEATSAGYSRKLGRIAAFGYVKAPGALDDDALRRARCEVDIAGTTFAATILLAAR